MKTAVVCLQPPKLNPDTKLMPSFYEYEVLTSHTRTKSLSAKKKKKKSNHSRIYYCNQCIQKHLFASLLIKSSKINRYFIGPTVHLMISPIPGWTAFKKKKH